METSQERTAIDLIHPSARARAAQPGDDIGTAVTVPVDEVDPNPFQPRSALDERALKELIDSIRVQGLLQPVSVRRVTLGNVQRYQLIAGHRRLEAFRRLREAEGEKFARIPAHWRQDVDDEAMAAFALSENLQRDDLPPLDSALALARFQEAHGLSTEALAKRMGLEPDRVKRLLRLARAPKVVQDACGEGVLVSPPGAADSSKRERARLDVMAALEFSRLHAQEVKDSPKKADERVARAIERALAEHWTLRRIQNHCRAAIAGDAASKVESPKSRGEAPTRPLFTDGDELRVRRKAIDGATAEERLALCEVLLALVRRLSQDAAGPSLGSAAPAVAAHGAAPVVEPASPK
jgi:ParB/RepB/Spo0J family partition protein